MSKSITINTDEPISIKPSEGKWAIFLGDCDNSAIAYMNADKEG